VLWRILQSAALGTSTHSFVERCGHLDVPATAPEHHCPSTPKATLIQEPYMTISTISPADLAASGRPYTLIDVRSPGEFAAVHAQGAHLVPLDRLNPAALPSTPGSTGQPVYFICASGTRAATAADKATAAGLAGAIVVAGGTSAWVAAGLPVVRGRGAIALDRQVRILAGALVVTGVAVGWSVHPYFYLLSGFIGAGLVFAGITDFCGMALLLARLPWNRASAGVSVADCAKPSGST
jgi:rhodanese-related sulfurtransferase